LVPFSGWPLSGGQSPLVLAPTALASLTTVADDGTPQPIRLGLIIGGDLERTSLAVREHRATVQPKARDARGDSAGLF